MALNSVSRSALGAYTMSALRARDSGSIGDIFNYSGSGWDNKVVFLYKTEFIPGYYIRTYMDFTNFNGQKSFIRLADSGGYRRYSATVSVTRIVYNEYYGWDTYEPVDVTLYLTYTTMGTNVTFYMPNNPICWLFTRYTYLSTMTSANMTHGPYPSDKFGYPVAPGTFTLTE